MKNKNIKINQYYYYAKEARRFKCIEVGDIQSWFIDYQNKKYQFYNHDMYLTKYNKLK